MNVERTQVFRTKRSYSTKFIGDRDAVRKKMIHDVATDLARKIIDSEFAQFTEESSGNNTHVEVIVTLCIPSPPGVTAMLPRGRWFNDMDLQKYHRDSLSRYFDKTFADRMGMPVISSPDFT